MSTTTDGQARAALITEAEAWIACRESVRVSVSEREAAELIPRLLACVRQGEWQDIATAPKGKREVLLWWPYWSHRPTVGYWKLDRWVAENALVDHTTPLGEPGPTHWMPLPEPPR